MSMDAAGEDRKSHEDDNRSDKMAGPEGTVPGSDQGVGMGAGNEPNTFEPEEDPTATAESTDQVEDAPADTNEPS
ncbi:hypothetical protein [Arthrobacter sp.]|uniref:hypothetical protein n=1 Tax=Arthrobacter sp. TaxID=1667 RepID=UPI002811D054|nr:hypothetical protein [Arthrobacter sp.]